MIYDSRTREILPVKTTALKNLIYMGRNVVIAAARKAPIKKHQDNSGNLISENYTEREVFWVSEERARVHKRVLTSNKFGATDLKDKMEINPTDTERIPDLTGT